MTLIIDMVTGEILEEDRPEVAEEEVERGRPADTPPLGPQPDLIPVTPDPRPETPPPPFWGP